MTTPTGPTVHARLSRIRSIVRDLSKAGVDRSLLLDAMADQIIEDVDAIHRTLEAKKIDIDECRELGAAWVFFGLYGRRPLTCRLSARARVCPHIIKGMIGERSAACRRSSRVSHDRGTSRNY
jgi:hypothetical protein